MEVFAFFEMFATLFSFLPAWFSLFFFVTMGLSCIFIIFRLVAFVMDVLPFI